MRQKMSKSSVVDDAWKVPLPKELVLRLNIKKGDEISIEQDKSSHGLVLKKTKKSSKEYLTQKKIINLTHEYTKMPCMIVKDGEVVVATETEFLNQEKILSLEVKGEIALETDYEQTDNILYLLSESKKYITKKIFSMKFFETNLGSLVIFDTEVKSLIETEVKDFIENIADFAVGNTCVSRQLLKDTI